MSRPSRDSQKQKWPPELLLRRLPRVCAPQWRTTRSRLVSHGLFRGPTLGATYHGLLGIRASREWGNPTRRLISCQILKSTHSSSQSHTHSHTWNKIMTREFKLRNPLTAGYLLNNITEHLYYKQKNQWAPGICCQNLLAQNLKHESFLKDYCRYCSFSYTQTPFDRHINALHEGGRNQL